MNIVKMPNIASGERRDLFAQLRRRSVPGITALKNHLFKMHRVEAQVEIDRGLGAAGTQRRALKKIEPIKPDSPYTAESYLAVVKDDTEPAILGAVDRHEGIRNANVPVLFTWEHIDNISRALRLIYRGEKGAEWKSAAKILIAKQLAYQDVNLSEAVFTFAFQNQRKEGGRARFSELMQELKLCDGLEFVREFAEKIEKAAA